MKCEEWGEWGEGKTSCHVGWVVECEECEEWDEGKTICTLVGLWNVRNVRNEVKERLYVRWLGCGMWGMRWRKYYILRWLGCGMRWIEDYISLWLGCGMWGMRWCEDK